MILFMYTNKACEHQAVACIRSIEPRMPDNLKIVYFTIGFISNFTAKNLVTIPIPERPHKILHYYRPELSIEVMDMFPEENDFFYTDTDILFSPRMDFNNLVHTRPYPLAVYGPHEYPFIWERIQDQIITYDESQLLKYLNIPERTMRYQWSCFYAYNRSCYDFLEEWESICNNKYITKRQKLYLPFPDETALNVCLWKRNVTESLGFIFVNTHKFETVKLVEENSIFGKRLENSADHLGAEWEYIHDSKQILFYHGFKDPENTLPTLEYLINR